MTWQMWLRDILSPLLGLGIEVHEVVVAPEPRYLAVITGLVLIGVPVDAAIRVLSGRPGGTPPDSPPPTPPKQPSSSPPSPGG